LSEVSYGLRRHAEAAGCRHSGIDFGAPLI
jgi:hypothetical protein